jgi:hypothetical protein
MALVHSHARYIGPARLTKGARGRDQDVGIYHRLFVLALSLVHHRRHNMNLPFAAVSEPLCRPDFCIEADKLRHTIPHRQPLPVRPDLSPGWVVARPGAAGCKCALVDIGGYIAAHARVRVCEPDASLHVSMHVLVK